VKLSGSLLASDSISFILLRGDAVGTIITNGQEQIIGKKVRSMILKGRFFTTSPRLDELERPSLNRV